MAKTRYLSCRWSAFLSWLADEARHEFESSYLVDSASSHMLVSRTKPCTPQNHCIAGICAWLITSDVICRKNLRSPHIGYLGETPS